MGAKKTLSLRGCLCYLCFTCVCVNPWISMTDDDKATAVTVEMNAKSPEAAAKFTVV